MYVCDCNNENSLFGITSSNTAFDGILTAAFSLRVDAAASQTPATSSSSSSSSVLITSAHLCAEVTTTSKSVDVSNRFEIRWSRSGTTSTTDFLAMRSEHCNKHRGDLLSNNRCTVVSFHAQVAPKTTRRHVGSTTYTLCDDRVSRNAKIWKFLRRGCSGTMRFDCMMCNSANNSLQAFVS